uniref:Minor capsid protein 10 n=1 Tax=uncultured marine virus TaxID=186617 RepID=A0A0F7LA23_9VIRU|nr:minor capsid protein 10 [uncultured marine virus]
MVKRLLIVTLVVVVMLPLDASLWLLELTSTRVITLATSLLTSLLLLLVTDRPQLRTMCSVELVSVKVITVTSLQLRSSVDTHRLSELSSSLTLQPKATTRSNSKEACS